jgi:hypothetical protein
LATTIRYMVAGALAVFLAACGTRSGGSIAPTTGAAAPATVAAKKDPAAIQIFDGDIANRKYHSLGDISVSVSNWTIFDSDPTPAKVDDELRKQAAKLGADAVILVRYGTVGMSVMTWGKLDGNGRAIAFDN